jgi:hypothetical protein
VTLRQHTDLGDDGFVLLRADILNDRRAPRIGFRKIDALVLTTTVSGVFASLHTEGTAIGRDSVGGVASAHSRWSVVEGHTGAFFLRAARRITVNLSAITTRHGRIAGSVSDLGTVKIRQAVMADLGLASRDG